MERWIGTVVVVGVAVVVAYVVAPVAARRLDDPYARFHARKLVRYLTLLATLIALAVVWRAFAGRAGVVLGLFAAGLAFAMQEVVGAIAGWFNIVFGRIFTIGDRIEMGGVTGDVIDITPLRTKLLEIGTDKEDEGAWIKGRQPTGRIVAISNKTSFEQPVFNYSNAFDYVWEELTLPIPHDADWRRAEALITEEAEAVSGTEGAREAILDLQRRYPMPPAELEPRVYVKITDNFMELSARFVVPVRTARTAKNELSRRIKARLEQEEIPIASTTMDVTLARRPRALDERTFDG
jgi:small-conductance mechanosensitive channel